MSALQLKMIGGSESLPNIEIPESAWGDDGKPSFFLQTEAGRLTVEFNWYHRELVIHGNRDALAAYGLYRHDWAPNPDGVTNRTTQGVLFTPDGPALVVGRFQRSWNTERHPYLVVRRAGTKFAVTVPLTPEQDSLYEAKRKERGDESEVEESREDDCKVAPEAFRFANVSLVGGELDKIKERLTPSYGLAYSAMSEARILRAINEVHRAFVEASIVPAAPKYEQQGNIVCWPGRGSVGPVSLAMG